VLDSTDPAQIRTIESKIDPARTLFIVSSKSGSTPRTEYPEAYFFECVTRAVGVDQAGSRFIAITDRVEVADNRGEAVGSDMSRLGFRALADGIRCCQILVWFLRRRWASTSPDCSARRYYGAFLRRQCAAGA